MRARAHTHTHTRARARVRTHKHKHIHTRYHIRRLHRTMERGTKLFLARSVWTFPSCSFIIPVWIEPSFYPISWTFLSCSFFFPVCIEPSFYPISLPFPSCSFFIRVKIVTFRSYFLDLFSLVFSSSLSES